MVGLVRTSDGKVLENVSEEVPFETGQERKKALASQVFSFQRYFALPSGDYWAELAVQDDNADTIATKTIPFSIEASKSKLRISDISLVSNVEPGTAKEVEGDPLRYGDQTITVNAAEKVKESSSRKLPIFLTVYPDPALKSSPKLELEIERDGKAVIRFKANMEQAPSTQARSFLASLPEDALLSGHYTLIARATQDDIAAERRMEFDYEGRAKAATEEPEPSNLLLTPMPKLIAGVPQPDEGEISTILAAARTRALEFQTGLPNFVCVLFTKRFYSKTGREDWKQNDTMTELLRYITGREEYSTVEVNGEHVTKDRAEIGGVRASGEFGQLLHAVFSSDAAAEFKWQGRTEVEGTPVDVFDYTVKRPKSMYSLRSEDGTKQAAVGFHGLVYVDPNTFAVRHVSINADDIPKDLSWRESNLDVDYDYVTVGEQKYLLPVSASLRIRKGKKLLFKNDMQFREYRRYTASSRILPSHQIQ